MKRTKVDKSQIILKSDGNRVSDKGLAFVTKGSLKLTQDTLFWQARIGEFGKKELAMPIAEISDVMVKKPLLLRIVMQNGDVHSFIIPVGVGKGKHKEDWQRILQEMAPNAQGSVLPEDDESRDEAELAAAGAVEAAAISSGPKFCMQCGSALRAGARFCSNCGKKVPG